MIKIIISVVSLLIAGAVFFLYTEPTYGKAKEIRKEIDQRNLALDKATELKKRQETLLATYNAFDRAGIDRLEKLLPNHVDNVRLILDLDRLAGTFGMAVQNVVISRSASDSADKKTVIGSVESGNQKYDSLTLKFSTRGTYSNFVRFLESLESSLRIVDIVSLSLAPEGQAGGSAQAAARGTVSPSGSAGEAAKRANLPAQALENIYKYDITVRTYWLR